MYLIAEKRVKLAAKIRTAHPDRIPVIVEKHSRSTLIPDIAKRKYIFNPSQIYLFYSFNYKSKERKNNAYIIFSIHTE